MKKDSVYLTHILEAINNIEEFVPNGKEQFITSKLIQHAVIRNLEIVGEATKLISKEFREQHPEIPWKEMAGMRDVLIHNYMGVDVIIVWNAVEKELPKIRKHINEYLK